MRIIKEDLFSTELSFRSTISRLWGEGGGREMARVVKNISIRVSQPWHYCHLGLVSALTRGSVLGIVGC